MNEKTKKPFKKHRHLPELVKKGLAYIDEEGRMKISDEGKKRKDLLIANYGVKDSESAEQLKQMKEFLKHKKKGFTMEDFERMWEVIRFMSISARPTKHYAFSEEQKKALPEALNSNNYVVAYNVAEQACSSFCHMLKTFLQFYKHIKSHWGSSSMEELRKLFLTPEKAAFAIASSKSVLFITSGYISDLKFFLSEMERCKLLDKLRRAENEIAEWEKEHPRWSYPHLSGKGIDHTIKIQFYIPYEQFKKKFEELTLLLGKLESMGLTLDSLEKHINEEEKRPSISSNECMEIFYSHQKYKWWTKEI
ncbi:MAG: hypothetical protein QW035_01490 [Candidatus Anstonellales archaeon]